MNTNVNFVLDIAKISTRPELIIHMGLITMRKLTVT